MIIDKIYLINLKKRQDRLIKVDTLLKSLGGIFSNYKRIEAVYGNDLSEDEIKKLLSIKTQYNYNNPLLYEDIKTLGSIGCYLSHINIWKDVIKNNYNNVIILEDDIKTNMKLNKIMKYIKNIPKDYDIAYLDYYCDGCDNNIIANSYWYENKIDKIYLTSAYIINNNAIKKLLEKAFPIETQIDNYINYYTILTNNFKRYISKEYIFDQGIGTIGIDTDITNLNCFKCIVNDIILDKKFIFIIIIILYLIFYFKLK